MDFTSFGLNKYENLAYVALLKKGLCTAQMLSKESGVPHGKVYPVLDALERKGFLHVYEGTPKRYQAHEPKIVIGKFLEERENGTKALRSQGEELLKSMIHLHKNKDEPLEKIRIIEGYQNYLNLSASLHERAEKEWLTISRLPVYKPHLDSYKKCIQKGVSVKVLTSITKENQESLEIWKKLKAEIKEIPFLPTRFSIMDGKEVILRISEDKKYVALWIQNTSLAESLRNYFFVLWKDAKKL